MKFNLPPLPGRPAALPQLPLPFPASGVNSYPEPAQPGTPAAMRLPPLPAADFDECVASGQSCSYGPHGPKGERQCCYCGAEPPPIAVLPPLPALPHIRIYSNGKWVTPWYPMRVSPWGERPGLYEMQFSDQPEQMEYWDGKRWPGIAGRFTATAWRGLAYDPATTA